MRRGSPGSVFVFFCFPKGLPPEKGFNPPKDILRCFNHFGPLGFIDVVFFYPKDYWMFVFLKAKVPFSWFCLVFLNYFWALAKDLLGKMGKIFVYF